jgi:hypothetical protein
VAGDASGAAVLWKCAVPIYLGELPGSSNSMATDINMAGQAAWISRSGGRAIRWSGTVPSDPSMLGGSTSPTAVHRLVASPGILDRTEAGGDTPGSGRATAEPQQYVLVCTRQLSNRMLLEVRPCE